MPTPRKSITDLPDDALRGKRALVRVDFNVPLESGRVADDTRIRAALPTLEYLADRGARIILMSHLGRPKGRENPALSLAPVASHLASLTTHSVSFARTLIGDAVHSQIAALQDGEILVLENTRFHAGEEKNDPELARQLAALGELYVNDAFGAAHRAHASTAGVAALLHPAVSGLLMQKELEYLGLALEEPAKPFVGVLGGAKISGKIDVLESLLPRVDRMLIGGAMACTFLRGAGHQTGHSLVEEDRIPMAVELMRRFGEKLLLPLDAVIAPDLERPGLARTVAVESILPDYAMFDIGPRTGALYQSVIQGARTVLWNGPMGVFEHPPFDAGTLTIANAISAATSRGATTIVGGGDSVSALNRAGLSDQVSHLSTGGGASLELLEGKDLPGVAALEAR